MPKTKEKKNLNKIPQSQKEVEAENARRAHLTPEERLAEDTAGVKTYDEKASDYKEYFNETLGMSDPGTEARIAAIETAPQRFDITQDDGREPELLARDEVRRKHSESLQSGTTGTTGKFGQIPNERKEANERLSDVLTDRKEHDEAEQEMTENGVKASMDRGGSEEAETGLQGKRAKVAVNEAKKKAKK